MLPNYIKKILGVLFVLAASNVQAQQQNKTVIDSLGSKIAWYNAKNQSSILFIHFDKTIYTNNENVWFTGYLLNADYNQHKTLSLALFKDGDNKLVMDGRYVINNNMCFGNMIIPDSLIAGNYSFVAYTNHLMDGQPDVLFTQPITIKNNKQPAFIASFNPLDTSSTASLQKVMLLVNFSDAKKILPAVPISYYVGNSAHPVLKGEVKALAGQYIFNIPSTLLSYGNNRLHATIKYNKEAKEITIDLPAVVKPALVRFYPEGGNLVTAIQNTIGWEVKSFAGTPLKVNALLYRDGNIVDTIETNNYGFGKFLLTPKTGSNYYVKLYGVNKKDTLYKLPRAIRNGPALYLKNAVVNDTLIVALKDNLPEKLHFIVHNYKQLFTDTVIEMATAVKIIKVILKDIPKGLTQITITDNFGRPFAQRLFFAHYSKKPLLQINTNSYQYSTRQKVTLKIKLNEYNLTDSGFVSIACTQENRLEINKKNDIESYFYLKHDLGYLPVKENYLGSEEVDKKFLENILLIKGWSRYTWPDLLKATPADTIHTQDNLIFKGTVTADGKVLKKPVVVLNLNDLIKQFPTDKKGNFILGDSDMVIAPGKKPRFFVNSDKSDMYQINIADPYIDVNKNLTNHLVFPDIDVPQQPTSQLLQMSGLERTIQLKEVKIRGDDDNFFAGIPGVNECGDYVCRYKIFNCPNHRYEADNRQPVTGQTYQGLKGPYPGCLLPKKNVLQLKGIYATQEFYPSDYTETNSSLPDYLSTIYWKYLAKVTSEKETEFSFYTSDVTGKFKIVVQGLTGTDLLYGEKTFNVIKPK